MPRQARARGAKQSASHRTPWNPEGNLLLITRCESQSEPEIEPTSRRDVTQDRGESLSFFSIIESVSYIGKVGSTSKRTLRSKFTVAVIDKLSQKRYTHAPKLAKQNAPAGANAAEITARGARAYNSNQLRATCIQTE